MAKDNPKEPYGDVQYADPGYQEDGKKRYPLDSEEHCRAAWSYINQEKNASKYSSEQLAQIKSRIKSAAKKYGIDIAENRMRMARSRMSIREGRTDWYNFKEVTGPSGMLNELYIYDEIGYLGITAMNLIQDLSSLGNQDLTIHLNTPGGEIFDGLAIYNALKNYPGNTTVVVDALAASIGSVIAMAGDRVIMAKNAELMIHEGHSICIGNSADMTGLAAKLDRASDNIASIYAEKTGGTVAQWREYMRAETWFNATEAVKAGLADEVQGQSSGQSVPTNTWDLSIFNHAARRFAPDPVFDVIHKEPVKDTPDIDWDSVSSSMKGVFK